MRRTSDAGLNGRKIGGPDGREIATVESCPSSNLSPCGNPSGLPAFKNCVTPLVEALATNFASAWLSQSACDHSIR